MNPLTKSIRGSLPCIRWGFENTLNNASKVELRSISNLSNCFFRKSITQIYTFQRSFSSFDESVVVDCDAETGVATIRIDRPESLNALSQSVCDDIISKLQALDADESVRCMTLTGVGKAFVAGADIKELSKHNYTSATSKDILSKWAQFANIKKPIIALVNGYALGGGCELAMMCDIVVAAENAKFGQPEILLGTIPGMGGTQRLTKCMGKSRAMECILTGKFITAEEAKAGGLVSSIFPAEELEKEGRKMAQKIAGMSLPGIIAAKECVNRSFESSLREGLLFERRSFHGTFATKDRKEGMSAFMEKRKPVWTHK